jgi:hypothetical protein
MAKRQVGRDASNLSWAPSSRATHEVEGDAYQC